jgi:hypothetical protein
MTPVTTGIATMPATSRLRSRMSSSGIATSRTWRSRNGETTPIAAEKKISVRTTLRRTRYGRNSAMMRRRFALRTAGSAGRSTGSSGAFM